jgi:hypothetical protein
VRPCLPSPVSVVQAGPANRSRLSPDGQRRRNAIEQDTGRKVGEGQLMWGGNADIAGRTRVRMGAEAEAQDSSAAASAHQRCVPQARLPHPLVPSSGASTRLRVSSSAAFTSERVNDGLPRSRRIPTPADSALDITRHLTASFSSATAISARCASALLASAPSLLLSASRVLNKLRLHHLLASHSEVVDRLRLLLRAERQSVRDERRCRVRRCAVRRRPPSCRRHAAPVAALR